MTPRAAAMAWIERFRLDEAAARELLALAPAGGDAPAVQRRLWQAVLVLAAALVGLGLILFIAANWEDFGRMGRFALLQGAVAVLCVGAALRPRWRSPLGLAALLGIGALFAYFGLTYQTGADPWQLFALWALLALPLALGARSDVVWAPWALVAMVGISLWTHAHTGHRWRLEAQDQGTYAMAWIACGLLVAFLSPALARWTGAGPWAVRTAGCLTVVVVTISALGALFHKPIAPHYPLALLLFGVAAVLLLRPRWFEVFLLSAVALGLDTLLVCGLAWQLFAESRGGGDPIGRLLLIGLVAAGLLAGSVALITRAARAQGTEARDD